MVLFVVVSQPDLQVACEKIKKSCVCNHLSVCEMILYSCTVLSYCSYVCT